MVNEQVEPEIVECMEESVLQTKRQWLKLKGCKVVSEELILSRSIVRLLSED